MHKNHRKAVRVIASIIIVFTTLFLLQRLLVPKYAADVVEGAFIAEYYEEVKDHDVIFIGDCEVYENFSPIVLWQEYGINSYIRGSAEQYIFQSYYLLEDTLRYETPKAVIFNVQSLQFAEAQNEAYNRMTLEGMHWSPVKVRAIKASMQPQEHFLDYVFPLLRYHSRWNELTRDDFKYMFRSEKVSHNGYYMRVDVRPAQNIPDGKPLSNYEFDKRSVEYLDKITALCKQNGIELILIKAPSLYPYWYPEWDAQVVSYAEQNGLRYINFLNLIDEIGIDYNTDTYDAGLHMNLSGAEKLSVWLGNYLTETIGLSDRRQETELSERWADKIAFYEADKQEQYAYYGINEKED